MNRIVVIDDEPLARSLVCEYLKAYNDLQVVAECANGFEGVKAVNQYKPDLIFLDIQMPKIDGFEMLELLEPRPAVIFTTAFDEYALKAFEHHALDYLLKPFDEKRLAEALAKWRNTGSIVSDQVVELLQPSTGSKGRIIIREGQEIKIISETTIQCIEAFDDYAKIFTEKEFFLKKKTMSWFEANLSAANFLRVHRSYIVRIDAITKLEPYEKGSYRAQMTNGRLIPLSRSGMIKLREKLNWQ